MNVTDEMLDAAYETAGISRTGYAPWKDHLRAALAAALAAAPTVDGWVWCDETGSPSLAKPTHRTERFACDIEDDHCPGPHRTLLLGPEVEA